MIMIRNLFGLLQFLRCVSVMRGNKICVVTHSRLLFVCLEMLRVYDILYCLEIKFVSSHTIYLPLFMAMKILFYENDLFVKQFHRYFWRWNLLPVKIMLIRVFWFGRPHIVLKFVSRKIVSNTKNLCERLW